MGALRIYITAVARFWWVVMTGVVMVLTGGYLDVSGETFGRWVWFIGILVALLAAPFLAWRGEWRKRTEVQHILLTAA